MAIVTPRELTGEINEPYQPRDSVALLDEVEKALPTSVGTLMTANPE